MNTIVERKIFPDSVSLISQSYLTHGYCKQLFKQFEDNLEYDKNITQ